jgi:hypothetical protein
MNDTGQAIKALKKATAKSKRFLYANRHLNTDNTAFWYRGLSSWLIVLNDKKCYNNGDIWELALIF